MKFDHKYYVPCLRWKQGEYQALSRLSDKVKEKMVPLIDLPEIGWDFEQQQDKKTLDEHIEPIPKRIYSKWGKNLCFVDIELVSEEKGNHPVPFIFGQLWDMKCLAVPVIRLNSNQICKREIKKLLAVSSSDICVRVTIEQLAKSSFKADIHAILVDLNRAYTEAHFILDLGTPNFVPLDGFIKLIQGMIGRIPSLKIWKSFSIIGTSFPETMAGKESIRFLPRHEWQLYKKLIEELSRDEKNVLPAFGDYAISHPGVFKMDMRLVKPAATIRYSIDDQWCIIKGKNIREYGSTQYIDMSKVLVQSGHFSGATFSFGDKYIKACADKEVLKPGLLPWWRQVGTNHHIEKAVWDLANFHDFLELL